MDLEQQTLAHSAGVRLDGREAHLEVLVGLLLRGLPLGQPLPPPDLTASVNSAAASERA